MTLIYLLRLYTPVKWAQAQRFEQVLQFIPKVNRPSLEQGRLFTSLLSHLDIRLPIRQVKTAMFLAFLKIPLTNGSLHHVVVLDSGRAGHAIQRSDFNLVIGRGRT